MIGAFFFGYHPQRPLLEIVTAEEPVANNCRCPGEDVCAVSHRENAGASSLVAHRGGIHSFFLSHFGRIRAQSDLVLDNCWYPGIL
jgi:hypothetical protein